MKRAIFTALLLACSSAFADPPADAPLAVVVVKGTFVDDVGAVHQVEGGAYEPHEVLLEQAQTKERLEWTNGTLKVLLGVAVAIAVAAIAHDVTRK